MKSLALKLTLAFLAVGLIGAFLVAIFVRNVTQREFGKLILDQNQQAMINNLLEYYAVRGSWDGVESIYLPGQETANNRRLPQNRWDTRRALFVITDQEGVIVFSANQANIGRKLGVRDLRKGVSLTLDGEPIGWLLFLPDLERWSEDTLEGVFLLRVNQAILLSALAATAVALLLGGVLAYTMTHSLRELTVASRLLAKGELGAQVKVRSQDEIGELATSFNEMSSEMARSNELRRKMTADIAHDLRTPLSVIMGYTEALNDEKLQPSPEMFAVMHSEALHLSHLIDDLKTLSLADAGELPLSLQSVSLEAVVQRVAEAYRVKAEQGQVALRVAIAPDVPLVMVDVERMVQVLGNLMDNALRYTPVGGEIRLSLRAEAEQVVLQVADNGLGIPAEDLPFIFERSYRGDKARQQSQGESGLGLAIARSLVIAQAGTITVASQPGEGTQFSIKLPALRA